MKWIWGVAAAITSIGIASAQKDYDFESGKRQMAAAFFNHVPGWDDGVHLAASSDTDVVHYDLNIAIDPAAQTIGGGNLMTIKSLNPDLRWFEFQLSNTFTISSLRVDGLSVPWSRLSSTTVLVKLPHSYKYGARFRLYVAYSGAPVSGGFGSIVYSTQGGAPLVYTLSEPWYAYTWWPEKEDNTDKATADLRFTVPNGLTAVSNGLLQSVTPVSGNRQQFYWKTKFQTAPYLFFFSVTNYNHYTLNYDYGGGTMPLEFYIYPINDTSGNRAAWFLAKDVLGVYADYYGLYPFIEERYGIYEFGYGGGMEHQTSTGEGTFAEWVTAHETGHQWWGDNITCATWSDIWLNEGFATYSEAIWYEHKPGSGSFAAYKNHMANRRPGDLSFTVYVYNPTDPWRIFNYDGTYLKGAWVLHMLRHILGDDQFFAALANYRLVYAGKSATTDDFKNMVSVTADLDMSYYFNQWVYQPGAPAYRYAWKNYAANGKTYTEFYVGQVQNAGYPTYKMPIDMRCTIGAQTPTYVIWNNAKAQNLLVETSGAVTSVAMDPDDWILNTGKASVLFVEGPPKVVSVFPHDGDLKKQGDVNQILATFHKDVNIQASDVSLVGDQTGSIAFSFSYDSATNTATITPLSALPNQSYTLTIADTVTDKAAGKKLDGEYGLPSGDGLPGGNFVMHFAVSQGG